MSVKSFITSDGSGRLTGTRMAQTASYGHYRSHSCGSTPRYLSEYHTEHPWFGHTDTSPTGNGQRYFPHAKPGFAAVCHIYSLTRFVPDTPLTVQQVHRHCPGCCNGYHGERHSLLCRTGSFGTDMAEEFASFGRAECAF